MKYYSLEPILSRGASLMCVIGHRSAGKTYAFKEWAIKTYLKDGKEWVYIRRSDEELNSVKSALWDDIAFKYNMEVKARGSEAYIREIPPDYLEGKELQQWSSENPWKKFGHYIPLNKQQNYKSKPFPKVDKICYDEFIIENTRRPYLNDEVGQFLSLVFTISRDRKVKTVLLSNSGFISNPFFDEYKVDAVEFERTKFLRRNGGEVVLEYFESEENRQALESTSFAKISTDVYKEYALDNKFKDNTDDLISFKPSGAKPMINLTVDGVEYLTLYTLEGDSQWYVCKGKKRSQGTNFSLSRWKPLQDASYNARIVKTLTEQLNERKLRFESPTIREKFIKWIKKE